MADMISVYNSGTRDANGVLMSATEARNLQAYNGALFLGTGRWCDTPNGPAQILRLDGEGRDWVVEWTGVEWPTSHLGAIPGAFPQVRRHGLAGELLGRQEASLTRGRTRFVYRQGTVRIPEKTVPTV